jgi:Protein of unknown function (DUF559)
VLSIQSSAGGLSTPGEKLNLVACGACPTGGSPGMRRLAPARRLGPDGLVLFRFAFIACTSSVTVALLGGTLCLDLVQRSRPQRRISRGRCQRMRKDHERPLRSSRRSQALVSVSKWPARSSPRTARSRDARLADLYGRASLGSNSRAALRRGFRRQAPLLGRFVADFLAPAQRLVIEVDGVYHRERAR